MHTILESQSGFGNQLTEYHLSFQSVLVASMQVGHLWESEGRPACIGPAQLGVYEKAERCEMSRPGVLSIVCLGRRRADVVRDRAKVTPCHVVFLSAKDKRARDSFTWLSGWAGWINWQEPEMNIGSAADDKRRLKSCARQMAMMQKR